MAPKGNGLTADELARVAPELRAEILGMRVTNAARLLDRDDLLLFLTADPDREVYGEPCRRALHIARGAPRARVCTTRRRFPRAAFQTGPLVDRGSGRGLRLGLSFGSAG